jgi:phosphoesterase RecJ-like protein
MLVRGPVLFCDNMLTQEQEIFEQIKKTKNILVTFRKTWNGDAVASAIALYLVLKKMGKNAEVVAEKSDSAGHFSFLPAAGEVNNNLDNLRKFIISLDISNAKVGQIKYKIEDNFLNFIIAPKAGFFSPDDVSTKSGEFKYDLVFVIDTPDLESLGSIYENDTEFFYNVPVINIDHHANNEGFGQVNHVELTAIATAEILFNLVAEYSRDLIDEDVATCLLTGIISKTRSFKTQNITPQALSISSQLVAMGARRELIVNQLYRSRPLNVLKLWGRVLARLTSDLDNKLVWSVLTEMDFEKTGTTDKNIEEVIDELMVNIPQARIILLLYETAGQKTKAIVYSTKALNSLDLAKPFNPAGTKQAARLEIAKPIQEAESELIAHIKGQLEKLSI